MNQNPLGYSRQTVPKIYNTFGKKLYLTHIVEALENLIWVSSVNKRVFSIKLEKEKMFVSVYYNYMVQAHAWTVCRMTLNSIVYSANFIWMYATV